MNTASMRTNMHPGLTTKFTCLALALILATTLGIGLFVMRQETATTYRELRESQWSIVLFPSVIVLVGMALTVMMTRRNNAPTKGCVNDPTNTTEVHTTPETEYAAEREEVVTVSHRSSAMPQAAPPIPEQMPAPYADTPATLLLVDDEPIILDMLQEILAPTGHRFITAANGQEALDVLTHDTPDIILLDLMMPVLDGFEVCRRVKTSSQWWTIPTIVLTALDKPEDYARAIDCGADDFMSKPLNDTILLARVRGYLRAKQMMQALRESEEYTRSILETALDAVVTIDTRGVISIWNAQAESIFGWSRQEAIGQPLTSLIIPPHFREAHEHGIQRFLETGDGGLLNTLTEITALHRYGHEFPAELAITPVRTGDTYVFNAFIRDISARKQAERLLHEAKEAAEAANQAKSEFLANMSHELRTPLHGILSFADFGLRKANTTTAEKIQSYFRQIDQSGRTLLTLLNNLLDLSKLEAGKMALTFQPIDLGMLTTTVAEEFRALAAERQLTIHWQVPGEKTKATVDAEKIKQVLRNLLSNAVKFSPPGGTITLDLRANTESVVVTVRDQGPGIPEDERETVFDKFVQSSTNKSSAGGTGLGLAICREILTIHQGRIWAEGGSNGAVFAFELPLHRQDNTE
jgi:two-component system sensor kinase FixL